MSRSSWKPTCLYNNKKNSTFEKIFIFKRGSVITENLINQTINIHNGIRFFELLVTNKMVGLKFGEFSPTRKVPLHKKKKNIKKKK
jgi:small subunit ribosomal protein S19